MKKNKRAFINKQAVTVLLGVSLAIGFAIGFSGCRSEIIPEISPNLFHEDQLEVSQRNIIGRIIKNGDEVVMMSDEGQVFRWNPDGKMTNFLYRLPIEIQPFGLRTKKPGYIDSLDYANARDFTVFKEKSTEKDTDTFIIFDLKAMKEIATIKNRKIKQVVAVDNTFLVYADATHQAVILNYRTMTPVVTHNLQTGDKNAVEKVFNCRFKHNKIVLLTTSHVYIYYIGSGNSEKIALKYKANSPFLLDRGRIYYGSTDRYLIGFSIWAKKLRWKFRIADNLSSRPRKIGPYIVVIPEDNNIYFFNRRGSLYWWEKLDSSLLIDPLPLQENAAVFLWDNSVKFFNYKEKSVITHHIGSGRMAYSNAVKAGEYLYLLTSNEEEERMEKDERLVKIGNHYGVKINSNPSEVMSIGKSIKFDLQESNLIDPEYDVSIVRLGREEDGDTDQPRVVFEKKLTKYDDPVFVWVPEEPTRYRVVVKINAKNKQNLQVSKTFETVNVDTMLQQYYYRVQTQCGSPVQK